MAQLAWLIPVRYGQRVPQCLLLGDGFECFELGGGPHREEVLIQASAALLSVHVTPATALLLDIGALSQCMRHTGFAFQVPVAELHAGPVVHIPSRHVMHRRKMFIDYRSRLADEGTSW